MVNIDMCFRNSYDHKISLKLKENSTGRLYNQQCFMAPSVRN